MMQKNNKAIFLDRDGTINVEKEYLFKIDDFEFIPRAMEALHELQEMGFMLIIVTNQSGIARGMYSEEDYLKLTDWMVRTLKQNGIEIKKVYYCPHHPDAVIEKYRKQCNCRKPKLGLFEEAVEEYSIDLSKSYTIGDKMRDNALCEHTQCNGFLIENNEDKDMIENVKLGKVHNVTYKKNLVECVETIRKLEGK